LDIHFLVIKYFCQPAKTENLFKLMFTLGSRIIFDFIELRYIWIDD